MFTKHLSEVSEEWKNGPGTAKEIKWPVGSSAPKNDGIAGAVRQNSGSIGYVEYGYAVKTGIAVATLENKAGKYIKPTPESATNALGAIKEIPEDFRIWLPDPEAADAYPIVTYTWIMCYKQYDDAAKLEALEEGGEVLPDGRAEDQHGTGLHPASQERGGQGPHRLGQHLVPRQLQELG